MIDDIYWKQITPEAFENLLKLILSEENSNDQILQTNFIGDGGIDLIYQTDGSYSRNFSKNGW